ncbi:hypothetical protein ACS4Z6_24520, partial [Salmonella enterica]|uniref:hypothetical protein n=1 Tax=Salmonella enterica TaxID=28901 RepID=UPI003F432D28
MGSCAAPSAKGDDKFITTDYLQQCLLPLRRGTDGKLGVVAAGSGGMAMFAPQYHIAISNTGPELTPQALKAVYDLGKKAAADFVQQQGRDGGRLSGAYR